MEFSELKKLEGILSCPICYELMTTSMITSCSHSFCSLCIRKFMQYKTECPICHEETHEINFRKNRSLDDVISIYSKIKNKLLYTWRVASATTNIQTENSTEESTGVEVSTSLSKTPNNVRTQNKNEELSPNSKKMIDTNTPKKNISQKLFESPKQPTEMAELFQEEPQPNCSKSHENSSKVKKLTVNSPANIPPIFQNTKCHASKKLENTVPCPVCNVDIPVKNMNLHLDSCLARCNVSDLKPIVKLKERNPLPKRVYDLMSKKDLKKLLKDYDLNTNGDRKTMTKRLQRYTVLYNAECDSESPRPIPELLSQIEREEKEEKKHPIFNTFASPIESKPEAASVMERFVVSLSNLISRIQNSTLSKDQILELLGMALHNLRVTVDKNADKEVIEKANEDNLYFNKSHVDKLIEAMKKRYAKYNRFHDEDDLSMIIVDPAQPSTSNCDHFTNDIDTVSVSLQDTICGDEDSNNDMFKKTQVKTEASFHTIDLVKSEVRNEGKSDEVTGTSDQQTSQRTNECTYVSVQHMSPATPERPDVNLNISPRTPASNNCSILSFTGFENDNNAEYESIFDTSGPTPKRNCNLSVSKIDKITKGTHTPESSPVKLEQMLEHIFEGTDVPEINMTSKTEYDESTVEMDMDVNNVNLFGDTDLEDNSVEEVSSSLTEEESPSSVVTTTFSPIKTRSKRKTISSDHHLQVSVEEATRKRRKHTKPTLSPEI